MGNAWSGIKTTGRLLASAKDFFATLQSIATILALCLAAWWFYEQRSAEPKIRIESIVTQRPDVRHPENVLVGLELKITNTGLVNVHLSPGDVTVSDVNPGIDRGPTIAPLRHVILKDKTYEIGLEPNEIDQCFFRRFVVPKTVSTIQITTSLKTPRTTPGYWNYRSLANIGQPAPATTQSGTVATSITTPLPTTE